MEYYYPAYYSQFKCLAADCPDTCCAKWEIVIDKDTQIKYSLLTDKFADFIRSKLITDAEGDICFSLDNKKCPFLNDDGLCEIHKRFGESYTSRICREHPRFYEEYDGFTEVSLSLSCPKSSELIFYNESISGNYPTPSYNGDDEVLSLLISSRKRIFACPEDFTLLKNTLLDIAADDQLDIDMLYIQDHPEMCIALIRDFLNVLLNNCEILTDEWRSLLEKSLTCTVLTEDLNSYICINNKNICKAFMYFVYRYYLKAVNDLDVYSRALFIILSCLTGVYVSLCGKISFKEAIRLFSKEIEHNTENIDLILDFLSKI